MRKLVGILCYLVFFVILGCSSGGHVGGIGGNLDGHVELLEKSDVLEEAQRLEAKARQRDKASVTEDSDSDSGDSGSELDS